MLREIAPIRRHAGGLHAFIAGLTAGTRLEGHRHAQPTLVFIARGALHVREGEREFHDTAGTLCLCPAGLTRSIVAESEGADCLIVTCQPTHPAATHSIWKTIETTRGTRCHLSPKARALVDALYRDTAAMSALESTCINLLTELHRGQARQGSAPPWLGRALAALRRSGGRSGVSRAIAKEIGIHAGHLGRVVRQHTGFTVRDYVRRERVAIAVRLLATSDLPLGRIAYLAGFTDQSHLTREFARRLGHVPSRHRRIEPRNVDCVQVPDLPGVHLGHLNSPGDPADPRPANDADQTTCS